MFEGNCLILWFFIFVIALAFAIELILFLNWRKENKYEYELTIFREKSLIRQIDAHFIFNFLSSLQSHIIDDDRSEAIKYISKFSNVLRQFLENSLTPNIPIQKELDAVSKYLEIEKFRFKDKFNFEIIIDEEMNPYELKMPSFLLQPYVENALYHGVLYLEKEDYRKGHIKVEAHLKGEGVQFVVTDNGVGRKRAMVYEMHKQKKSLGNQFIEERLALLTKHYKKNFSMKYIDLRDDDGKPIGTSLYINIPIIT